MASVVRTYAELATTVFWIIPSFTAAVDSLCFPDGSFSRSYCCKPPAGSTDCWDTFNTYQFCCGNEPPSDQLLDNCSAYVRWCTPGVFSPACDLAADALIQSLGLLAEQAPACHMPRCCGWALLRSWDAQTRETRNDQLPLASRVAWCTERAAMLQAWDPQRFLPHDGPSDLEHRRAASMFRHWLQHCRALQQERLLEFRPLLKEHLLNSMHSDWPAGTADGKVGLLVAVAGPVADEMADFIRWWKCYADRHGYLFLQDDEEPEDMVPPAFAQLLAATAVRGVDRLSLHTLKRQVSRYAWLKWISAKSHLGEVDWLLLVDPDMYPTPGCGMDVPVVETYERICSGTSACSVISNDMWPRDWAVIEKERRQVGGGYLSGGQDKNAGFTMIRNDQLGHLFLDLVLERRSWFGLGMPDQDAAGEALLELISLENSLSDKPLYDNGCMVNMFLTPASSLLLPNGDSVSSYRPADYGMCWLRLSVEVAGPVGHRQSAVVGFTNPLLANLNVNPIFSQIWQVPPGGWSSRPSGPAKAPRSTNDATMVFLHFAGVGEAKKSLMEWFALAYYGLRPNASCSDLQEVSARPRRKHQPRCAVQRLSQSRQKSHACRCSGAWQPVLQALHSTNASGAGCSLRSDDSGCAAGRASAVAACARLAMIRQRWSSAEVLLQRALRISLSASECGSSAWPTPSVWSSNLWALKRRELMCKLADCAAVKWSWEDSGLFSADPALRAVHGQAARAAAQWATEGLQNELAFWKFWLGKHKEGSWVAASSTEDWTYDDLCALAPRPSASLLNAGSGPVVPGDIHCEDGTIEVISADGLADLYERLYEQLDLWPPKKLMHCSLEELSTCLPNQKFDLVHVRNALDHALQPTRAIREMLKDFSRDEAAYMNFTGMHQWSFELDEVPYVSWGDVGQKSLRFRGVEKVVSQKVMLSLTATLESGSQNERGNKAARWLAKNLTTANLLDRLAACEEFGLQDVKEKILEQLTANTDVLYEMVSNPSVRSVPGVLQDLLLRVLQLLGCGPPQPRIGGTATKDQPLKKADA
ncbi:hypothetical protein AK812_SmicGene12385 [Symbiodinium microadriaticum]|uniref:Uncharacterized protein n=1 Tax=Symbiodinium microadriaticum TaxID=2951 RepID=A0A1Q9EAV9_SYMMI|nr:hypothetical protein AK812_SmicGene12385 [Symbiodinium microadriaticum]